MGEWRRRGFDWGGSLAIRGEGPQGRERARGTLQGAQLVAMERVSGVAAGSRQSAWAKE